MDYNKNIIKLRDRLQKIWDTAPEEKHQEALKWEARLLDVDISEVSSDKIIDDILHYQQDIADVDINSIDDIIDFIR